MKNNLIHTIELRKPVYSFSVLNWILIIGAIVLFGNKLEAQEQSSVDPDATRPAVVKMLLAPPNEHKLHVYVNDKKFIYWPQDKPIFFWLGTSSDEKAELFPLLHSGTTNSAGHWKPDAANELEKYRSDGLKLEISSNQFVRWLHHYNKKETTMRFIADGVAPESQLQFVSKKRLKNIYGLYFSGDAIATLSATDAYSGVEQTYLSVNGKTFLPSDGMKFSEEGYYLLRHYAVDRVGNTSETLQTRFYIDKTPPVTNLKMVNATKNIFGPKSTLSIPSQDTLSGVHVTYYNWNSGEFKRSYKNRILFEGVKEGANILQFYTEDLVGNAEGIHKVTLGFDKNGPEVSHEIKGDQYIEGGKVYLSSRSQIFLKAVDEMVDVQSIEYQVNGLSYGNYEISFRPPVQTGEFKMDYQGIDIIGNKSILASANFVVDSQSPTTRLITDGVTYRRGPNVIWVNTKTRISLKALDDVSGVQSIFYKFNENKELLYKGPFTISDEGRHTFQFSSVDHVNNKEVLTPVLLVVDDTPPEIKAVFNRSAVGSEGGDGEDKIDVYPLYTTLFLNADDNSAKLKGIRFSVNGSPKEAYQEALLLDKPGNYYVIVEAEDNLGNISNKKMIFIVKAG